MKQVSGIVLCMMTALLLAGCASPRDKVVKELRGFGVAKPAAKCMGRELDERLEKREMKDLARFLDRANDGPNASPGRVLDAIARMDDKVVVDAAMKSGLSCTLLR